MRNPLPEHLFNFLLVSAVTCIVAVTIAYSEHLFDRQERMNDAKVCGITLMEDSVTAVNKLMTRQRQIDAKLFVNNKEVGYIGRDSSECVTLHFSNGRVSIIEAYSSDINRCDVDMKIGNKRYNLSDTFNATRGGVTVSSDGNGHYNVYKTEK